MWRGIICGCPNHVGQRTVSAIREYTTARGFRADASPLQRCWKQTPVAVGKREFFGQSRSADQVNHPRSTSSAERRLEHIVQLRRLQQIDIWRSAQKKFYPRVVNHVSSIQTLQLRSVCIVWNMDWSDWKWNLVGASNLLWCSRSLFEWLWV